MTQLWTAWLLLCLFLVVITPTWGPDLWETARRKVGSDLLWLGLRLGRTKLMRLGLRIRGGF